MARTKQLRRPKKAAKEKQQEPADQTHSSKLGVRKEQFKRGNTGQGNRDGLEKRLATVETSIAQMKSTIEELEKELNQCEDPEQKTILETKLKSERKTLKKLRKQAGKCRRNIGKASEEENGSNTKECEDALEVKFPGLSAGHSPQSASTDGGGSDAEEES
ncbi:hypothetical protein ONE63_001099 [Megalurothrips usitatus]|uniref:Uncharacterized protein n=1 Tax=Megalurothrips usitatus TaxID=439358 RepID=A0AAV7XFN5_9NEOP|nr:hypothetical protein ONE63_001099 [Megalurothrips usitatus]